MNHVDGIKVLHTVEKYVGTGEFNWLACIIAFFIILAILTMVPRLVIYGQTAFKWQGARTELGIGSMVLFASIAFGVFCGFIFQIYIPRTEYKICIIDEEKVNMIDFNNTYEVLNKEGEIYTVIFKDSK